MAGKDGGKKRGMAGKNGGKKRGIVVHWET